MVEETDAMIEADIQRAARGLYTELEWWIASFIRLADVKIAPEDAEYAMFRRMLHSLHMDNRLYEVSLERVQRLIAHNLKGRSDE